MQGGRCDGALTFDDHQHQTVALPSRVMVYDFLKIKVPSHLLTSKCCIIHYGFEDINLELKLLRTICIAAIAMAAKAGVVEI